MQRNLTNLIIVAGVLVFITACFCRPDRGLKNEPTTPSNSTSNTASGNDKKPSSSPGTSTSDKKDEGDFTVEHVALKSSKYTEIDKQVRSERLLEKAADQLNKNLVLPYNLELRTEECGQVNAFYDSSDQSVTVCYELMEHFFAVFRSSGLSENESYDKMFDAVRFVFLHEIGHALTDTYKLPITGNEEDAADRCSAFINLTELGEDGVNAVLAAAESFRIESKQSGGADKRDLADEHLLQEQRFYNSLCMLYGSNTSKYSYIVPKYLPKARAERCETEFQRTADSWASLLRPWRKG